MTTTTFTVGDIVRPLPMFTNANFAGRYRITKVNPKTYRLEPLTSGRPVRAQHEMVEAAPEEEKGGLTRVEIEDVPILPPVCMGQVVSVEGPGWKRPASELYVVIAERADGRVKIVRLGGDDGRYWPKVPRELLTVVDNVGRT